MADKKPAPRWLKWAAYASVALLVVVFVLQSQAFDDWLKLRGYTPAASITKLADDTTMSRFGKKLFYINHAEVSAKKDFAKVCPSGGEKTIVLGCYKGGQNGIHILAVTDRRLKGVEQVTAAHEMLHAGYERLSEDNRKHLDGLLQDFFQHKLHDQRIKDILKSYEESEPGQQLNEMHSIFGTEVRKLTPELEAYYGAYFEKRSKVVDFAENYQAEFTRRQNAIRKDDAQLNTWKTQIETNEMQLRTRRQALDQERQSMEKVKTTGQIETYNTMVAHYNAEVDAYNMLLDYTKKLIGQYNDLVEERNAIAVETFQLQKALNGELSPIDQ